MKQQEIVSLLAGEREVLHRLGVVSLKLFGSHARDEAQLGSDVDLIVDLGAHPDFDRFMDIKFHLEQVLGASVDLVTEAAVRPQMRDRIIKEAIRVA